MKDNYVQTIREKLQKELGNINSGLVQYYTLAVILNGGSLLGADVHDTYSVWAEFYRPNDPVIRYNDLPAERKEYYENLRATMNSIAIELTLQGRMI